MKEITREQIDFMVRTLQNYYFCQKEAAALRKEAFILDEKIKDERKGQGISYDGESGTYNNTDTPYICSLIHEQATYEMEAIHYEWAARDLDKHNHITKRLSVLSNDQKLTINAICKHGYTLQQYAVAEGVSRQAIKDRLNNTIRKMMEVE